MKRYPRTPHILLVSSLLLSGVASTYAQADLSVAVDASYKQSILNTDASTSLKVDEQSTAQATSTAIQGTTSASFTTMGAANVTGSSAITLPGTIQSASDLEAYTAGLMSADDHITAIDTSEQNKVSVDWKQNGKFFALFPVTLVAKTTIKVDDGKADVETDMPWWRFFVSGVTAPSKDTENMIESSQSVQVYAANSSDMKAKADALYTLVTDLELDPNVNLHQSANVNSQ